MQIAPEFTPIELLEIDNLDALKCIADPLRNQIMEVLEPEPQTVNKVADKLGVTPSKLYYHINLLEKHGFIQVVNTTVHGNIIEKHYWIRARDFTVDKSLINFGTLEGQENISAVFVSTVDTTREDMIRSLQARAYNLEHGAKKNPRNVMINRVVAKVKDSEAHEFMERLKELVKEYESMDKPESDEQTYALTVVMYPSFYYDKRTEE